MNGRSVGYQARGSAIPETSRAKEFPVMYPSTASVNQKDRDYEYSSTDDDRNGFPDKVVSHNQKQTNIVRLTDTKVPTPLKNPSNIVHLTSPVQTTVDNSFNIVRLTTPVETSFENPSNVIRLTSPSQTTSQNPSNTVRITTPPRTTSENRLNVVRLTQESPTTPVETSFENPSNVIRLTSPSQTTFQNPSNTVRITTPPRTTSENRLKVVRLTQESPQNPSNVGRLTSSDQISSENPSELVQFVNPERVTEQEASAVRLTSSDQEAPENPSSTVRFVGPTQRQVVRLTAPKKKIAFQPTRASNDGYQVIMQERQRQPQSVQLDSRPSYYSGQRFVPRPSPQPSGRLNPFLSGRATSVRDNYGRWIVRGNNKQARFVPSVQTVFIDDDDLDDFDYDFDDDDFQHFTTL
uniref:Uncharacterized protein n=1 Tax=Daphnia magna TaxID=35525 RepID=A0A0P5RLM4_9CRUS